MAAPLIAIVTPIPVEWEAMCARITDAREVREPTFLTKMGHIGSYRIVCLQSGKGQATTAVALKHAYDRWRPSLVILSGIAGGFPNRGGAAPGRGPRRGDVVVANHVYHLDFGKLADGKYTHRPDEDYGPRPVLREAAETFMERNFPWVAEIDVARPDRQPPTTTRAMMGYVGSGSSVVDDTSHEIFRAKLVHIPEIDAIEMEACGAAAAAQRESCNWIMMVRGVSDEPGTTFGEGVGSAQRDEWKKYAAAASATFVRAFLLASPGLVVATPIEYSGFRSLESAIKFVLPRRRPIGRPLADSLLTQIRSCDAVLVEGAKSSGKSSIALLALLKYREQHGQSDPPIYYLNAADLGNVSTVYAAHRAIRELPPDAVLFLDDVHRQPRDAIQLALAALRDYQGKLVVASRAVVSDDYEHLRNSFMREDLHRCRLFDLSTLVTNEDLRDLVMRALADHGKQASADEADEFLKCYGADLPALFDAVEEWLPGTVITDQLADEKLRSRLERDPDFEIEGFSRDRALGCFLAVAAFWQFEIPTRREFLLTVLGLDWSVSQKLVERGVLKELGEPGWRLYQLEHELVARRYLRLAGPTEFSSYLRQRFRQYGLRYPDDPQRLAAHLLLLEVMSSGSIELQIDRLRWLNNGFTYGGYGNESIGLTGVFRENDHLLKPAVKAEILASGGGVRRRRSNPQEAEEWLGAALDADAGAGLRARGRILYEQAYLTYYRNDFQEAERRFNVSAEASSNPVGREMSLTKAAESRFQALVFRDPFTRNLLRLRDEHGSLVDMGALRNVCETVNTHLARFRELSRQAPTNSSDHDNAGRWISNCLVHLCDVYIELGDDAAAEACIMAEQRQLESVRHSTVTPVVDYLRGRLALVRGNAGLAAELLGRAYRGYRRLERDEGLADVMVTLGDALSAAGESTNALNLYQIAASTVNPERRNLRGVSAARERIKI